MRGVLQFFGWAAFVSGAILAIATVVTAKASGISIAYGFAWFLGGFFWLALCQVVANIDQNLEYLVTARPSRR